MASVRRLKSGAYEIRAYAGREKVTGQLRNLYDSLPASASAEEIERAREALQRSADAIKAGNLPFSVRGALEDYLSYIESDHSPTTLDSYRSNVRCYVYPFVGNKQAGSLDPYEISMLYRRLLSAGGKDENPLSTATVSKLHAWLKAAFDWMVAVGILPRNPFIQVRRPKLEKKEAEALSEVDLGALLDYLEEHADPTHEDYNQLDTALFVCLSTGVRRGELAGWWVGDYKPRAHLIGVRRTLVESCGRGLTYKRPKSASSARNISIDRDTCALLDMHVDWLKRMLASNGIKVRHSTPLFCDERGKPIPPRCFAERLKELVELLGLDPSTHLHTLRHTHATMLLEIGTNIRTLQERLGHSDVSTTLRIYSHVLPGRDAQAADAFGDAIRRRSSD